jgi:formimidoylglutamate deiminase
VTAGKPAGSRVLRFQRALLPEGWRSDVAVTLGDDGMILSVETGSTARDRIGGIAFPGVANLHSHAFQRAMAGLAERAGPSDDSFWSWRTLMYRFVARMTPEDAEAIAAMAYVEMLETGFTHVAEFHYLHHQADGTPYSDISEMGARHLAAASRTGIGITMLPVFYAQGGFGGVPPLPGQRPFVTSLDGYARLVDALGRHARGRSGATLGIAPHSLRAVTPEQLRVLSEVLPGAIRHIHVSEQTAEVDACVAFHGTTPIVLLGDHVSVDGRWVLIHATHATEPEQEMMARTGATVGLCPITEANLGDGIFPAADFVGAGGHIGVGSDSNVLIGLADECRQLEYSQRLALRRRNVLAPRGGSTGRALLDQATAGGARACGLAAAGIRPGAAADIVVLDASAAALAGRLDDDAIDTHLFGARTSLIREVYARGAAVVNGGRHVAREQVEQEFAAAMRRLIA